jgi:hypothetical protein
MYIGDGAKLVRDAFELAKQKAPAIIFIDELDAVGTKRFDSNKAGDREVQRTMLELLNQLDGFSSDQRIKVIAATNRIDILDPALLRSGRLDRKIEFPLPNETAREQILKIHARKLNHVGVNFEELARSTEDFNGAQLKAVCVEAGMLALRQNATQLTHEHFHGGILEVQSRKSKEHHVSSCVRIVADIHSTLHKGEECMHEESCAVDRYHDVMILQATLCCEIFWWRWLGELCCRHTHVPSFFHPLHSLTMSPTFPPLAALFLTHFHDLSGQEVVYYASMSNGTHISLAYEANTAEDLPASLIEHASLPSGMHQRSEDLVTFAHHGLPAAGLFRSCTKEGGRGRRMGTLGVVLAPPAAPDAPFDVAPALAELYDRLGGIEDPFDKDAASVSAQARTALLDAVWAHARAGALAATQAQSAKTVAVRLARGVKVS